MNAETEQSMLHKIDPQPVWGEKCAHGSTPPLGERQTGRWAVKLGDEFFVFEPGTQMQKDIWLTTHEGSTRRPLEVEFIRLLKLGSLRWYCGICGTVQEP